MRRYPEIREYLACNRSAELVRGAEVRRLAQAAKSAAAGTRRRPHDVHVSLRVERVSDQTSLEQLAALDGRIVAALPVAGARGISDPFVPMRDILPLLELRAAQIRGAADARPRPLRRRLLLRRA